MKSSFGFGCLGTVTLPAVDNFELSL